MDVLHVAAECFPVLKAGGMGDVLGSLPKYQHTNEQRVGVIVPFHDSKFVLNNEWEVDFEGDFIFGWDKQHIKIWKQKENTLGFYLFLVNVTGMFPRKEVYGYHDDVQRFIFFQIIVLNWINQMQVPPKIIHCHDHTTGLIPFLIKYGWDYQTIAQIPTVFTIHNGEYQGQFTWRQAELLPEFHAWQSGFLDYDGIINPVISAVKNAWAVTTVSDGYLTELMSEGTSLGKTLQQEANKVHGILNGIDTNNWNPAKDELLQHRYTQKNVTEGKQKNKEQLCNKYGFNPKYPLLVFIGRMVHEKGLDYMIPAIRKILLTRQDVNFVIIGSGQPNLEQLADSLKYDFPNNYNTYIGYNEELARLSYAAADFLLMPSRIEPCGLNQMYAMQYGTTPIVRKVGGLKDTVQDIEDGGQGFTYQQAHPDDLEYAIRRAIDYPFTSKQLLAHRKKIMNIDFSWEHSAQQYNQLYKTLLQ